MITYKMKRELRDAWIHDLTSGNFVQTTGILYSDDTDKGGYCCLGVLVCSAQRIGLPIELNEANTDAVVWEGTGHDGGEYTPIQEHLFVDGMDTGTTGFFSPFVRRNDGFHGNSERAEPSVPQERFTQIAEFIRDNVEAVDELENTMLDSAGNPVSFVKKDFTG